MVLTASLAAATVGDDEVARVLEQAGITFFDARCFAHPDAFEQVVVVGAYDGEQQRCFVTRKLVLDGAVVDIDASAADLLRGAGWAEADAAGRSKLALSWTKQVRFVHESLLEDTTEHFGGRYSPVFAPPQIEATDEGGVRITAWFARADDDDPALYRRRRLMFEVDASVSVEELVRYAAPREQPS
jgi:hypothetical protein